MQSIFLLFVFFFFSKYLSLCSSFYYLRLVDNDYFFSKKIVRFVHLFSFWLKKVTRLARGTKNPKFENAENLKKCVETKKKIVIFKNKANKRYIIHINII